MSAGRLTPGIYSLEGVSLVAGVEWLDEAPKALSSGYVVLAWEGRYCAVEGKEFAGHPALASMLLSDEAAAQCPSPTLLVYSDAKAELHWTCVAVDGIPVIGDESLYETASDLVEGIQSQCEAGQIESIFAPASLSLTPPKNIVLVEFDKIETDPRSLPSFGLSRVAILFQQIVDQFPIKDVRVLGLVGAGVAALVVGFGYLAPRFLSEEPVLQTVRPVAINKAVEKSTFVENCTSALDSAWPRVPGWQFYAFGCVGPEMVDPSFSLPPGTDAAAYSIYRLDTFYDPKIARAAARQVYSARGVSVEINEDILTGYIPFSVELETVDNPSTIPPNTLKSLIENRFVGVATSVQSKGVGQTPVVEIRSQAEVSEILRRAAEIDGISIVQASSSRGVTVAQFSTLRTQRTFENPKITAAAP